jgi:ATP/maltotriose-dependent transcriptional regulator MalT
MSAFYPRERVFQLLDQAARAPVVWVSAPPGAGKTTLVASWLESRDLPALWYHLDAGDSDLATFFYYLGRAAGQVVPTSRKPLPLFTPEYQFGLSVFSKRFFEGLFSRLKPPAVVVFDDYHEIPADSPFHGALRDGLETIPQGMTAVLISRKAPVAAMARMKARGRMEALDWDDLRLSLDETKGLADLHCKKELPPSLLQNLHEKARGWAAGIVLMLAGGKTNASVYILQAETPHEEIFDYFAGELFEKMDEDTRKFLLMTAFLPSMTAVMAERLSGFAASGKTLAHLCRNRYFTEMHIRDTSVYQYHPLFREFLLFRARELFSPDELGRIQKSAAALLAEEGLNEDAAMILRIARDWKGLVGLVLSQAQALMAQGRHQTLQEWIEAVPQEIMEHNPWLLFWLGACRLPVDPNGARDCFEQALAGFDADADSAGVFMAWSFAVDSFLLDPSGVARLDHWIALIDELMMRYPLFPSPIIEAHVYTGILFALAIRQPQRPETGEWAKRALALSAEIRDPQLYGKTAQVVILYHIWSGDLPAVKMVIEPLRESIAYRGASPPLPFIALKHYEALYCWLSAQAEARAWPMFRRLCW